MRVTKKMRFDIGVEYGKKAYHAGKSAACQDAPFIEIWKDHSGHVIDLLKGWNRGWAIAHVEQPDGVIRF